MKRLLCPIAVLAVIPQILIAFMIVIYPLHPDWILFILLRLSFLVIASIACGIFIYKKSEQIIVPNLIYLSLVAISSIIPSLINELLGGFSGVESFMNMAGDCLSAVIVCAIFSFFFSFLSMARNNA
jgi:hypothetical protein